jgi:MATE family multidrug resistance protein
MASARFWLQTETFLCGADSSVARHPYFAELRPTLALAFPIIVGQVSQMLMGITDTVMIGRVGKVPLAAAAFAHGLFMLVFIIGVGVLMSVSVLVARAHGAGRSRECAEYLRHGMGLALLLGLAGATAMAALGPYLHRFGQPPEVVAAVRPYFELIGWSLLPALVFQVQRQFSEAVGHPWAPMGILLGGVLLNAILAWMLIYGHWGVPALGLEGAGWATLLARTLSAAVLWWWLARRPEVRAEWPRAGANPAWLARLERVRLKEMLGIGLPAAGQLLFEVGAFAAAALMMGWIGTVPLAAHQIALSCAGFTFMFPLGISIAVAVRISRAVGEGRREALRPIGFGALGAGALMMLGFALLFALMGRWLAAGFTPEADVVSLAARLLVVAAIFQIFDGGQVIGAAALRGLADVRVPMGITFVAYWVIALPQAYLLGVRGGYGAVGIWWALAAGLASAALLLGWRFYHKTRTQPGGFSRIT